MSLYLVLAPSDLVRMRPLIRLLVSQLIGRLTESLDPKNPHRHRLLGLLDEFPTLGRLSILQAALAYTAGYGIRWFLIAQSLNQLEAAYGQNNSILDNAHIRVTYGALDERTADRISKLLGQATEHTHHLNFSGSRLAPWLGHVSESQQEHARPLLTPGEILQLPSDEAILMVGGIPPYRAKKVTYYQDDRFQERANLPPPNAPEEQEAELIPGFSNPWDGLRAEPPPTPDPEELPAVAENDPEDAEGVAVGEGN